MGWLCSTKGRFKKTQNKVLKEIIDGSRLARKPRKPWECTGGPSGVGKGTQKAKAQNAKKKNKYIYWNLFFVVKELKESCIVPWASKDSPNITRQTRVGNYLLENKIESESNKQQS